MVNFHNVDGDALGCETNPPNGIVMVDTNRDVDFLGSLPIAEGDAALLKLWLVLVDWALLTLPPEVLTLLQELLCR
jgi:hypothetical protein